MLSDITSQGVLHVPGYFLLKGSLPRTTCVCLHVVYQVGLHDCNLHGKIGNE